MPDIFSKTALDRLVAETLPAVPEGHRNALVATVDEQGVKVVAAFSLADDGGWRVEAAYAHDWDGDDSVAARLTHTWK